MTSHDCAWRLRKLLENNSPRKEAVGQEWLTQWWSLCHWGKEGDPEEAVGVCGLDLPPGPDLLWARSCLLKSWKALWYQQKVVRELPLGFTTPQPARSPCPGCAQEASRSGRSQWMLGRTSFVHKDLRDTSDAPRIGMEPFRRPEVRHQQVGHGMECGSFLM